MVVTSGVIIVRLDTAREGVNAYNSTVKRRHTGRHGRDDVLERLDEDRLVGGVGKPRVREGLAAQGGVDANAPARGDALRAVQTSPIQNRNAK